VLSAIIQRFPWLRHVFADGGYAGNKLMDALRAMTKWTIEIVKRFAIAKDFEVLPRQWAEPADNVPAMRSIVGRQAEGVERTLAWLNRDRRLAKDFENTVTSATAWLFFASVQLLTRRIAKL
jgi:transposase